MFPDLNVVQPTLLPYLPNLPPNFHEPNSDSPLLSLRLTTLEDSSVLGIKWAHILGDAASAHRFLRHLSACYTGEPIFHPPSLFPHIDLPVYPPTSETLSRYDIPQIRGRDRKDTFAAYGEAATGSETMVIRLSRKEVAMVRMEFGGQSDQDAISAWWINLHERIGLRIRRAVYTVNVSPVIDCAKGSTAPFTLITRPSRQTLRL